jgi:hypothetical protein
LARIDNEGAIIEEILTSVDLLGRGRMETKDWLTIAGFAFLLLNTWLKDWLERRRARQAPEQPQSQTAPTRIWLARPLISFLLPTGSILFALISLTIELVNTGPITRMGIFTIALDIGLIFFQTLHILLMSWVDRIYKRLNELMSLQDRQLKVVEHITAITSMSDDIDREET